MKKALQSLFTCTIFFLGHSAFAQKDSLVYTGNVQKIIIPACTDSIIVDVVGAQGGGAFAVSLDSNSGGLGGRVQATLPVHGGDSLLVYVGGKGDSALSGSQPGPGGFNGGDSGAAFSGGGYAGGGGGGGSDIRLNGRTLAERIVVAGGGGGGGYDNCFTCDKGGNGGGLIGDSASHEGNPVAYGGTQTEGGKGAFNGTFSPGDSGSIGMGGLAGNSTSGGGGGGGYYGGGGGSFGGGAGGSGYAEPTAKSVIQTTGYRSGNGYIVITMKTYHYTTAIDSSVKWDCKSSFSAVPTGGFSPYTYAWSGASHASTDTINNVCAGDYKVVVTDKYGCKDSASFVLNGIDELVARNGIKVYPVPTTGMLNIEELNQNASLSSLQVFDITGREVMDQKINSISAHITLNGSSLQNGVYFLKMIGHDGSSQKYVRFEIVK